MATASSGSTAGGRGWSRRAKLAALASVLALAGVAAVIGVFASQKAEKSSTASSPATIQSSAFDGKDGSTTLNNAAKAAAATTNAAGSAFTTTVPTIQVPAKSNGDKQVVAGGTCYAATWTELVAAVTTQTCNTIVLTGTTYTVTEELTIPRSLTITGDVATLPYFDIEEDVARTFRVLEGVYFQLRYVSVVMSEGIKRPPLDFEFATSEEVLEIRGGSVLFEDGALGGMFVGVFFLDDPDPVKGLNEALEQIEAGLTVRVYGGHVFATSGEIDFIACMFYDLTLLYPGPNFLQIGGDVLMYTGTITFTSCVWMETTFLGVENGVGLFVANLLGTSIFTGCHFQENNAAVAENSVGQGWLTAGGLQVITTTSIAEFSGVVMFSGSGETTILAGVSIMTGVANEEAFGVGSAFGIGMEYTVGAGVHVQTGMTMLEWNGIFFFAGLGDLNFLGSGVFISTGTSAQEYISILSENGQGGVMFNGGGYSSWVGTSIFDFACIAAAYMSGEYLAQNAGLLVFVEGTWIETAVIEGAGGLGSIIFVGGGGLVLYDAALVEWYGPIVQRSVEFWITGTCEEEGEEEGGGGEEGGGEEGGEEGRMLEVAHRSMSAEEAAERELIAKKNREMYTLPIWVPLAFGCGKYGALLTLGGQEGEEGEEGGGEEPGEEEGSRIAETNGTTRRGLAHVFRNGGPLAHLPKHVRRHMTNLHGAKSRRILLDYQDMGVGVYAANVVRKTELDGEMRKNFEAIVPESTFKLIDSVKDSLASFHSDQNRTTATISDVDYPAFHIDTDIDGYCGLCNVPGRTCEIQNSCEALDAPYNAQYFTPEGQAKSLEDSNYEEHRIISASLEIVTASSVEKLDLAELQEAIVAAFAHIQGDESERDTITVNVWPIDAHPLVKGIKGAPSRSLLEGQGQKTHHAEMGILVSSQEMEDIVIAAIEGVGVDGLYSDVLIEGIKAAFLENTGTELAHVEVEYEKAIFVPAYKSHAMHHERHRDLGDLSLMILDPEQLSRPVTHAEFGKTYHLYLDNWPADTHLNLRLLKFKEEGENEFFSTAFDNVWTDEKGTLQMDITFDHRTLVGGEYFLQASLPTGEVGFSPSYIVSHQPQPRKLYGPSMWM